MSVDAAVTPSFSDRHSAVTALFRTHHARLVGLARLLVDDLATAEDVVQDAFAGLYRQWPWMRNPDAAVSYLNATVANGARSTLRHRRVVRRTKTETPPDVPSAESSVIRHEQANAVLAALRTLPARQREVLVLRYYLDQSEAEIASTLSISRGSVKQHASRGIATLGARLEAAR